MRLEVVSLSNLSTLLLVCTLHQRSLCKLSCSLTECARYLETIKVYENKPADLIQGQMDTDYLSRVWKLCSIDYYLFFNFINSNGVSVGLQLNHSLTSIRHVNKSDVVTLGSTFGVNLQNLYVLYDST